jgi:transcription antitermination factor NusG
VQMVDLKDLKIGDFVGSVDMVRDEPVRPQTYGPSNWYVVLTHPQQEISTVWRLHELGLELYTPIFRRRVKTGRVGRNGHPITRAIPRPMFPGYGFIRQTGIKDLNEIRAVRGVRDFLRIKGYDELVMLPHEAVMAVFDKQYKVHQDFIVARGGRKPTFKPGDLVKVEEGNVYSGLMARVDKIDSKGRIEILLGMIRHTLPAEMVVAA